MRKHRFILLSFVIFFSTCLSAIAQEGQKDSSKKPQTPDFAKMMRSPTMQEAQKRGGKVAMRSFWNGNGMNLMLPHLLNDKDIRDAWRVSDEQYKQIQSSVTGGAMDNPELIAVTAEIGLLNQDGNLFSENVNRETLAEFGVLQEKLTNIMMDSMASKIDDALTPEQKESFQEFQLAAMSEVSFVTPKMFEVLGLSDEQKEQMEKIKTDLDPEFDQLAETFMDEHTKFMNQVWETAEKEGIQIGTDPQKNMESMQKIMQRAGKENDEYKKIQNELKKKGQLIVTQLKFKMFDVLTDEQLARLEKIVNNPPEYVEKMIAKMKNQNKADPSKAFMDAWKPGEPIPEEYKEHRKRKAFPLKEK